MHRRICHALHACISHQKCLGHSYIISESLHLHIFFAFSTLFRAYSMAPLVCHLAVNLAQCTIFPPFLHYTESFLSFLLVIYLTLSLFYIFLNYFIFSLAFFFQFPYTFKHGVKHSALRGKFSIIKKELNQRSMTHEQSGTDQKI